MRVLVTGFDPFGGETVNSGWEAVRRLPDRIGDHEVVTVQLPTSFGRSAEVARDAIEQVDPDVIINVGQAGGAATVLLERVAVNVDDAPIPDNDGDLPVDRPIRPDGPAAYLSGLPIKQMVAAVVAAGVPAAVSNTAGTFVCNHVFYEVRHLVEQERPGVPAGFVHVPLLPDQVAERPGVASMSLEQIVTALTAVIATCGAAEPAA